jgi:cell division septation protein DedD
MRDVDKLKEKIELTLDNQQVVSLVIGSLVVLGVVFVLGVMVGKQLAVPATNPAQQDPLAAIDQKAAPKPPKEPDPPLTFTKDLLEPVANSPAPKGEVKADPKAEKPVPKPEPKLAEVAKAVEAPKPAAVPKGEEARPSEGAKAPAAESTPSAPKVVSQAEPKAGANAESKAPEPESKPAPALDKKLAEAFNAARAAPKVEAKVAPPPPGSYTVQVAASQQKTDVDQVMSKLRGSGLSPYLVDANIPGKGRWFRVRVGSFRSRNDAEKYVHDLKRETGMSGFVTSAQ